jgi:hypothetical protein
MLWASFDIVEETDDNVSAVVNKQLYDDNSEVRTHNPSFTYRYFLCRSESVKYEKLEWVRHET